MDPEALKKVLPPATKLHLGPLSSTIPRFLEALDSSAPIGFVALDVDYWSSTAEALALFKSTPVHYLPRVVVYVDDVALDEHNSAAGASLAIQEFNREQRDRPLEHHHFLATRRVFCRAAWIKQTMFLHVLDHPHRSSISTLPTKRYIENPYLGDEQPKELFHPFRTPRRK